MKIIKATLEHSREIFNWRNDLQSRKMFISGDEVTWENHTNWYLRALDSDFKAIYIGKHSEVDELVGMVRFDIEVEQKSAEVSINLNPYWRGKRVSVDLLSLAIKRFRNNQKIPLFSTVKKCNQASIKCFERCNFTLLRQEDNLCFYELPSI